MINFIFESFPKKKYSSILGGVEDCSFSDHNQCSYPSGQFLVVNGRRLKSWHVVTFENKISPTVWSEDLRHQTYIPTIRPWWRDKNFNNTLEMKINFYRTHSNCGIFFCFVYSERKFLHKYWCEIPLQNNQYT